jgi:hypothetical protein
MRVFLAFAVAVIPLAAQSPSARLLNMSRPDAADFQVGDRFEVAITGAPNQPVSVRTTMQGRTNWGPVIGSTDANGRWSVSGQFEKADFGDWREVWTIGGRVVNPVISFSVAAPCPPGGQRLLENTSASHSALFCDSAAGPQTFVTHSAADPFRTPDGRVIPGQTRWDLDIISLELAHPDWGLRQIKRADQEVDLIAGMIGVNALDEKETRVVLALVREARRMPPATITLLQHLAIGTDQEDLKKEISEMLASVGVR